MTKIVVADEAKLAIFFIFFLFFLFSFFYAFCFPPTSGILRKQIFFQPSYFGMTRRNIKKINHFLNLFFYKSRFSRDFSAFYDQRSVAEPGPTPSPWSIQVIFIFLQQKKLIFGRFFFFYGQCASAKSHCLLFWQGLKFLQRQ